MNEQAGVEFEVSSGNVFADLGYPDAEEALTRAKLAAAIGAVIKQRGLTQTQAAEVLGLAQPHVSALSRGRLRGFSLERLVRCLLALQRNVDIVVSESPGSLQHGHVNVVLQSESRTDRGTPAKRRPRGTTQTAPRKQRAPA